MKEKKYKVYIHRNKINNKVYIGITGQSLRERWRNGNGYKRNLLFYRAIKKYGWSNFTHEILFESLTKDEACDKEVEMIALYKATNPDYGYNLSNGGEKIMSGYHFSEETRQKIRESRLGKRATEETKKKMSESRKGLLAGSKHPMYGKKGKDSPLYGRHHTQESRKKMHEKRAGTCVGAKNVMYGKHHTQESKEKNRKSQPTRKAVICLDTQEIFLSISEASKALNICHESIAKVCDGKRNYAKGYKFKYIDK